MLRIYPFLIKRKQLLAQFELATKRLRILSIPPNDKIRNHSVSNPITRETIDYLRANYLIINTKI